MRVFVYLLAVAAVCHGAYAAEDESAVTNGFLSMRITGGVIRDLRADPAGKGNYGPVLARTIYVGLIPEEARASGARVGDTVTFQNAPIYINPREVGLNEADTPVRLEKGATLGQLFTVDQNGMASVSAQVPTWSSANSAMTLKLFKDGPGGKIVAEKRCENVGDNSWQSLSFPARDKGVYYIEMSEPRGSIGWWSAIKGPQVGVMYENSNALNYGSRCFRARVFDVFPAQVKITVVGPKLFADVVPDKPDRQFQWRVETPFERSGYETRDPKLVPFSRFFSDTGAYMPIAQLKRQADGVYSLGADKSFTATGNGGTDAQFACEGGMSWSLEPGSIVFLLGKSLALAAKPNPEPLPEFMPAFYSSDPAFDKSLNSIFHDRAYSWPIGGVQADWFEWMALIHFWNYRPGSLEHWRATLLKYKIDEQGYVYTWGDAKGWPFPDNSKYDTRHFTTNSNFILASYRFYAWTRDREFLESNAKRLRSAMRFMLEELKGADGIIVLPDKDHGGTPDDVASNYWDDLPFGGRSAYENAYYYAALGAMASIETALGSADKASYYNDLRAKCRTAYNAAFWNNAAGRYIGCIDKNGVARDYGFTFVNLEAAFYGLPDKAQVERIYHWMERDKTSSGKVDTYARFRFAPRANTIDCKDWWYLNGKAEIASQKFDTHLENGGAILYTSGYDVMARAKYLGADNAFRRLREILARYEEPDHLAGGSPLRYGEVNGWQVGTDTPFPESGLVGASFLHAFLGIQATLDGLLIQPNLPGALKFAGVRNLHYRGLMLDVRVTRDSVTVSCDDPANKFRTEKSIKPGEGWLFTGLEK